MASISAALIEVDPDLPNKQTELKKTQSQVIRDEISRRNLMKLTFKDLPRPFWYRVGLLILFFSIFCVHIFTVKQHSYDLFGDILDTLGYLLATAFCLG